MPAQERAQPGSREEQRARADRPAVLQWIVAGLSGLLVLAVLAFTIRESMVDPGTPPVIVVRVEKIVAVSGGYRVEFRARNRGHTTAAGVTVEGSLARNSGEPEKSEATLDYVPARGERKGGLFFTNDPRGRPLSVRARGYDVP